MAASVITDDAYQFCLRLREAKEERQQDGTVLLRLPVGVFPFGDALAPSVLVITACYVKFADALLAGGAPHDCAVLGTPGIGKTWFLIYLAWRAIAIAGTAGVPARDIVLATPRLGWTVLLRAAGGISFNAVDYVPALGHKTSLYLYDATKKKSELQLVSAQTIIASSPDLSPYPQYTKERPALVKKFMPVWSLAEMSAIAVHAYGSRIADWQARMEYFGGVPRQVFVEGATLQELKDSFLNDTIRESKIAAVVQCIGSRSVHNEATSRLLQFIVDVNYQPVRVEFVSAPIGAEATHFYVQSQRNEVLDFLSQACADFAPGSVGGATGKVLEETAHELLAAGGTFRCRRLGDHEVHQLYVPQRSVRVFQQENEVQANVSGQLFLLSALSRPSSPPLRLI